MPEPSIGDKQLERINKIDIESTVTPSRGPMTRHNHNHRSLLQQSQRIRPPFAPIREPNASFDGATTNSVPQQLPNGQENLSCRGKLQQLRLLHNSNSVDYVRGHNPIGGNESDIYGGPNSFDYGYVGYSSMRSNLKSAASEFSFIRPASGLLVQASQSTLPNKHRANWRLAGDRVASSNQQPMRPAMVLANESDHHQLQRHQTQDDSNNNSIILSAGQQVIVSNRQALVNQAANGILNHSHQPQIFNGIDGNANLMAVSEIKMSPLMRELPMKPHKRRLNVAKESEIPKSSSLTSSIASFFRRAFAGRSKRRSKKRSNELSDVCSTSLSAFEDKFSAANGLEVRSAFSTGGKSADGQHDMNVRKLAVQSPRMVDMIEAFHNKTQAAQAALEAVNITATTGPPLPPTPRPNESSMRERQRLVDVTRAGNQIRESLNQFSSPLHKSSSMSTSMGFSQAAEAQNHEQFRNLLYDNEVLLQNESNGLFSRCSESPMMNNRSAKVMSANLTPILSLRGNLISSDDNSDHFNRQRQNHSRLEHIPRPSSIYGQPSLISPIMSHDERANMNSQFGSHRNSMHSQMRDRSSSQTQNNIISLDFRRQPALIKATQLDPTKEVCEDLASPTSETKLVIKENYDLNSPVRMSDSPQVMRKGRDIVTASPSTDRLMKPRRQAAIVNPIPQSPTVQTIYDNHPMLQAQTDQRTSGQVVASHYDNHNGLIMTGSLRRIHGQSDGNSVRDYNPGGGVLTRRSLLSTPPRPDSSNQSNSIHEIDPYTIRMLNDVPVMTPARRYQVEHDEPRSERGYRKPSEFVAPMMSSVNGSYRDNAHNSISQSPNHSSQLMSPMLPRRQVNQLKQSPLISQNIILDERTRVARPVINIAGAPGINLDPSLAASLLQGTQIDAYENSAFLDDHASGESKGNSKTFLISDRLSKSMSQRQGLSTVTDLNTVSLIEPND